MLFRTLVVIAFASVALAAPVMIETEESSNVDVLDENLLYAPIAVGILKRHDDHSESRRAEENNDRVNFGSNVNAFSQEPTDLLTIKLDVVV